MEAVTEQKAVPSIKFSSAKGNFEREKEMEDTMLLLLKLFTEGLQEYYASSSTPTARSDLTHEVVEEQSHDEKLHSVATDVVRDTLANGIKSKKGILGSQPSGNHNVFSHFLIDPICEVCKKQKQQEPSVESNLTSALHLPLKSEI